MKASELIIELQQMINTYGDHDVYGYNYADEPYLMECGQVTFNNQIRLFGEYDQSDESDEKTTYVKGFEV